jgi:hypothetical protein
MTIAGCCVDQWNSQAKAALTGELNCKIRIIAARYCLSSAVPEALYMPAISQHCFYLSVVVTTSLLIACSDSNNSRSQEALLLPVAKPMVELPPGDDPPSLISTTFDLGAEGFVEEEYFLSGTASAFVNMNELRSDGRWEAKPESTADYRTRVVVYRPASEEDFSGTVIVEWMNVTFGFDVPIAWGMGHTEALRSGHAWVNVTAQKAGIEGTEDPLFPLHLFAVNPERYGSLNHPGDSFSYDIYSQVTAAVRDTGSPLLGGFPVQVVMATGESQSASRLLTYINAIQPLYGVYDAFLVDSRYNSSAPLSQPPQTSIQPPAQVLFRDDLTTPVINLQSETDLFAEGLESIDERQEDSAYFRLWEIAGGSHLDNYGLNTGRTDNGSGAEAAIVVENNTILGVIQCPKPINSGVVPWVYMAAMDAANRWVREEQPAPVAERLATTDDLSDFLYDDFGIARGGVRTPYVDAPAARLSGEEVVGVRGCFWNGTTALFDATTMASLYVDRQGYIDAVSKAADAAIDQGFLLPADAQRVQDAAGLQWDAL